MNKYTKLLRNELTSFDACFARVSLVLRKSNVCQVSLTMSVSPSPVALCRVKGDDMICLPSFPKSPGSNLYAINVASDASDAASGDVATPVLVISGLHFAVAAVDADIAYNDIELYYRLVNGGLVLSLEQVAGSRFRFFFKVVAATTKCSHIVRVDESFLLHSVRTLAAGNGGTTGDDVVAELRITVLRPHRLGVDTDDDNNNAEHEMDKIMENTVSRDERNSWARERMLVAETSPASSPSPLDASPSESAADGDTAVVPPLDALLRAVLTEAGIRPRDIDHDGMKMRADKLRSHARNLLNKGATLPPACSTPLFDDADLNSMLASHRVKSLELKVAALEDLSATKADFAAALATTQEHARNAIAALEDQSATKDELGAAFADAHEHARIAIAALVDQSATKGELAALAATQVAPAHGLSAAKTDLAALIAVQQQDLSAMRTQLAALTALVQERPAAPPPPLPPFGLAPGKAAALSACLAVPHGLFLVGVPAAVGNRLGKHNCPTEVIFIAFGNLDQGVGPIAQPGGNVQVCPIGLTEQSTVAAIRGHLKATSPALVGILVPSHCELVRADPVAVPEGRSGAEAQGEDEVIYVIEKTGANMWTMSCFLLAAVSHWRVKP